MKLRVPKHKQQVPKHKQQVQTQEAQPVLNNTQQEQQVQQTQSNKHKLNIKFIIIGILVILLIVVGTMYLLLKNNKVINVNPGGTTSASDIFIKDKSGNIKKQLIINNSEYTLNMDLLGPWKENLSPIENFNNYQALLIPETKTETTPYFYIQIDKSNTKDQQSIIKDFKSSIDSFVLENISQKDNYYTIVYDSMRKKDKTKNYTEIFYQNGYQIKFTYSAINMIYSQNKGYIDDMINSFTFKIAQ